MCDVSQLTWHFNLHLTHWNITFTLREKQSGLLFLLYTGNCCPWSRGVSKSQRPTSFPFSLLLLNLPAGKGASMSLSQTLANFFSLLCVQRESFLVSVWQIAISLFVNVFICCCFYLIRPTVCLHLSASKNNGHFAICPKHHLSHDQK